MVTHPLITTVTDKTLLLGGASMMEFLCNGWFRDGAVVGLAKKLGRKYGSKALILNSKEARVSMQIHKREECLLIEASGSLVQERSRAEHKLEQLQ